MAAGRAHEHQVGDVGARNQQHEPDRDEQHDERGSHAADQLLPERADADRPPGVRRREVARDVGGNPVEVGGGGCQIDAVLQPADQREALAATAALLGGRERVGRPDLDGSPEKPRPAGRSPSPGKRNQAGSTPTMLVGAPLSETMRPITAGSASNRRRHRRSPMTTT